MTATPPTPHPLTRLTSTVRLWGVFSDWFGGHAGKLGGYKELAEDLWNEYQTYKRED